MSNAGLLTCEQSSRGSIGKEAATWKGFYALSLPVDGVGADGMQNGSIFLYFKNNPVPSIDRNTPEIPKFPTEIMKPQRGMKSVFLKERNSLSCMILGLPRKYFPALIKFWSENDMLDLHQSSGRKSSILSPGPMIR